MNNKELLREAIIDKIASGDLKVGDKIPSEKELSQKYGITIRHVKNILSDFVAQGIIQQYRGRGSFINSIPSTIVNKNIGLVYLIDSWVTQNLQFTKILDTTIATLRKQNYNIIHFPITENDYEKMVDEIINKEVDGILLVCISNTELINKLIENNKNPICINYVPEMNPLSFKGYAVYTEHYTPMIALLKLLKDYHHSRIAYIGGWMEFPTPELQLNRMISTFSFKSSAEINGICNDINILDLNIENKSNALKSLLTKKDRPTAIITNGPDYLPYINEYVKENNIRIPEELSLVTIGWPQEKYSGIFVDTNIIVNSAMYLLDCHIRKLKPISNIICLPEHLNNLNTIGYAKEK